MQKTRGISLMGAMVALGAFGVVATVTLPNFGQPSAQDQDAAARRVATSISQASSMNYAQRSSGSTLATVVNQHDVCDPILLSNFVNGITLVDRPPQGEAEYRIVSSPDPAANTDCSTINLHVTTAECAVLPSGSGVTAQRFTVFCTR